MGLPHVLQNAVAKLRAWGRSKRTTDAPPRIHRSAEAFTITSQECAVPVVFRQREQWQFRKRTNGPSTSNATSPHMQLPRNAAILVSSPHMTLARRLASSRPTGDSRGSHLQASHATSLSACGTQFQPGGRVSRRRNPPILMHRSCLLYFVLRPVVETGTMVPFTAASRATSSRSPGPVILNMPDFIL